MAKGDAFNLERWRTPPIYRLLSTGNKISGRHTNKVWTGLVHADGGTGVGVPAIVKWMPKDVAIATELACGLAAQALNLDVPAGILVLAEADQLPGLPMHAVPASGASIICFGSELQWHEGIITRPVGGDEHVEEMTWSRLCHAKQGAPGAAWDELVANSDRHYENVLFDGQRWWLFDHERALPPLGTAVRKFAQTATREKIAGYFAKSNELAAQMVRRRPADHGLAAIPQKFSDERARLHWIADQVRTWNTGDSRVDGIFTVAEVILRSIELRLPALAMHLGNRLNQPKGGTLWTTPETPKTNTPKPPSKRKTATRSRSRPT